MRDASRQDKKSCGHDQTDCKLHKYCHTYLSYLSFILSLLYLCSELPFSSRTTILHRKRQRFAAMIAVNFVTVFIVDLTQYYQGLQFSCC